MADAIQSFLDDYGQGESHSIPEQSRSICCCGNEACAYLQHNQSALEGLERDVSTAARLGKALLMRHEAYIADSERERKDMTAHIETLEAEKLALEKKNATVIEENRNLLDQLEAVNTAVAESDAHVINLQATLQSTQQELNKLTQLAARTEWLERQLADFEREQASWQTSIEAKDESEKSAVRRWQKAERTLASLEDQIERIEREAKEERERHREIVDRMERRRAVEKELGSAASRLKGAAALKDGNEGEAPTVVSHFVKDILQDNANLQMGIVELRELLNNSNEEVETLRSQLLSHQPVDDEERLSKPLPPRQDLREEMTRANSQELHVHHHYHAPPAAPAQSKPQALRRPRKKRVGAFTGGYLTPTSGSSTPRSSFSYGSPTPTATILQQTAASIPRQIPARNRWSTQSNLTYQSLQASSGPSSPQSTANRSSSIFDRVFSDAGFDSSRPTTPDTEEPASPVYVPAHSKRGSQSSVRTNSAPIVPRGGLKTGYVRPTLNSIVSVEELPTFNDLARNEDTIPEETTNEWDNVTSPDFEFSSDIASPFSDDQQIPSFRKQLQQQPLRRAASHESLLSVSGMDIHTLKSRPSQLLAPYGGRGITTQAIISDTNAQAARPSAMSRPTATGHTLLSGMAAGQRQAAAPASTPIGKKVGGWIFGKWGTTPAPTSSETTPTTAKKTDKARSASAGLASTLAKQPDKPVKYGGVSSVTTTAPTKQTHKPPLKDAVGGAASTIIPTPAKPIVKPEKPDTARTISSASDKLVSPGTSTPKKIQLRPPGINQSGPLLGYFPEAKSPPKIPVVNSLDAEALRELLDGK